MRRYVHRKGQACTPDQDRCVAPASKKSLRDCPRCKRAKNSALQLRDWQSRAVPPRKAWLLARSSRSVNFRFFGKRSAQLNERNTCIAKLRAAMHTFDDQFDFVDRLRTIAHADQIRVLEGLIRNRFSERPLVIQCDFE